MSVAQCARKRNKTTDRISNLPEDLTQQILECLPLQDAARTSILSRHWRNKWTSIPQLLLNLNFFCIILNRIKETADISLQYSKAVSDILLSHAGPICKFVLYVPSFFPKESDTSKWIRYACSNGVKDFTLVHGGGLERKLPTCLFSCEGLTHLTLIRCRFLPLPPTFRGFPCLVSLKVEIGRGADTCVEVNVLEILISKCPELQNLSLRISGPESHLIIRAPKLHELFVECHLSSLSLEGATTINKLTLDFWGGEGFQHSPNMSDLFSNLLKVESLILGDSFWKTSQIYKHRSPKKLPRDLERLRSLKLVKVSMFCHSNVSLALCLLMSSPNLQRLYIEASNPAEAPDGPSIQIDDSCIFPCLKNVQLIGISGLSNELQLIKYLLVCSLSLEEVTIELSMSMNGAAEEISFLKESMRYPRASPNAKINIKTGKTLF